MCFHPRALFGALLLCIGNLGCVVGLGSVILPNETVTVAKASKSERLQIESVPRDALVTQEGVMVGKTPIPVTLPYEEHDREIRLKTCGSIYALALADLVVAGAGGWASYSLLYHPEGGANRDWGKGGMLLAGAYAAFVAVGTVVMGCKLKKLPPVDVPVDYHFQLTKHGWKETLEVRVPGEGKRKYWGKKVHFRAFDESEWRVARSMDTIDSYSRYLEEFKEGDHQSEASRRQDELLWKSAVATNSVEAYERYLHSSPTKGWQKEAKTAIDDLLWQEAMATRTFEAYGKYLIDNRSSKWRNEAKAAASRLLDETKDCAQRTRLTSALLAQLSDRCGVVPPYAVSPEGIPISCSNTNEDGSTRGVVVRKVNVGANTSVQMAVMETTYYGVCAAWHECHARAKALIKDIERPCP